VCHLNSVPNYHNKHNSINSQFGCSDPSLTHDTGVNFDLHTHVLFALTKNLHLLTHHSLLMGHIFTRHPQTSWTQIKRSIIYTGSSPDIVQERFLSHRQNVCVTTRLTLINSAGHLLSDVYLSFPGIIHTIFHLSSQWKMPKADMSCNFSGQQVAPPPN